MAVPNSYDFGLRCCVQVAVRFGGRRPEKKKRIFERYFGIVSARIHRSCSGSLREREARQYQGLFSIILWGYFLLSISLCSGRRLRSSSSTNGRSRRISEEVEGVQRLSRVARQRWCNQGTWKASYFLKSEKNRIFQIGVIGYCFGGMCALDMARRNMDGIRYGDLIHRWLSIISGQQFPSTAHSNPSQGRIWPRSEQACRQDLSHFEFSSLFWQVHNGEADPHIDQEQVIFENIIK